jgi:tRNA (guanine-N7-)-methyltransferase
LTNARVACFDARVFVRDRIATGTLAAVHVYFPDPWWKKRHHKRRLWTPDFAEQCGRILRVGGRLHIATDVGEYYQTMRALLDARPALTRESADERVGSVVVGESLTNFELKARVKGGAVWRAEYVKRA